MKVLETRVTTKAVSVKYLENILGSHAPEITIPAGTEAMLVPSPGGGWVVASERLLVELTGNTHDPKYRYCWLPDEAFQ